LKYAEGKSKQFRAKYLEWIHNIGQRRVDGKRIVDHLVLDPGLSYWWLTRVAEKNMYTSPISDVVRLFALEDILERKSIHALRVVSRDPRLASTLESLCERRGIEYELQRPSLSTRERPDRVSPSKATHTLLIEALRALARHLRVARCLKGAARTGWFSGADTVFLCDYFVNVDRSEADQGRFRSAYWGALADFLSQWDLKKNWLHHNAAYPGPVALQWLTTFNANREQEGFHTFLKAFKSWAGTVRILVRWVRLSAICWRLGELDDPFRPSDSALELWPLVRDQMRESLMGATAMENLIAVELFDRALGAAPHQTKGLYLCENAPWERAMIHAWRRHGHGHLVGVAHTTVRYWDLRYATDPQTEVSDDPSPIPRPDAIAVNGVVAREALLTTGAPEKDIVECEALRYMYLADAHPAPANSGRPGGPLKVLVVGDINRTFTGRLLRLLADAAPHLADASAIGVKAHPASPLQNGEFPTLEFAVVSEPLGEALSRFDVAFASSTTSGAVDAWLAGLPVVVMLDDTELNFSPLRGKSGVRFVSTPDELVTALRESDVWRSEKHQEDFFYLDPRLPKWQAILTDRPTSPRAEGQHRGGPGSSTRRGVQ